MTKVISMDRAVAQIPDQGATVALGGITLYRRPFAFSLELAGRHKRAGAPKDLTLIAFTAGLESDLLVGEGIVSRVRTCYFGLEVFGLAPNFTKAAGEGSLKIIEESEASLVSGLRASMAGIGFMPSPAWVGTDLPRLRPDVKTVIDPYSGEELTAFPALEVDIAVIHAIQADEQGNARVGGNPGVDPELALIADVVILTAEEVVPELPKADILAPVVNTVVHAPSGAWPTSCHPLYPLDGYAILDYLDAVGTEDYPRLIDSWRDRLSRQAGPASPA